MEPYTSIFYADDDVDDLNFFKDATDAIGKRVELFEFADQMLDALHNPPPKPSIIFLDLNMPGKSGFDILEEIKMSDAFGQIPVVILSTANDEMSVTKSKKLGANFYVCKPTSVKSLKICIEFVLDIDWENFKPSTKDFVYKS